MFIVYTSINGLIQGIASITESSSFIIFITTFSLFFASNEFTLRSVVVWKFKMADIYLHCFYIDKWPNSRYSLNNWIVIFHREFRYVLIGFYTSINWPLWSDLRSVHKIWPLPGSKVWIKYGLYKCSMLDKRDP